MDVTFNGFHTKGVNRWTMYAKWPKSEQSDRSLPQ